MDGIDWAGSAMLAARARLDVATNNLANVSTDGFSRIVARGRMTASGVEIERVLAGGHGAFRKTGRPYDLAIVGDGAFSLYANDGTIGLTRNGAFERDRFGTLRDAQGRAVLGLHGPVRVPDGATIDNHGRVMMAGKAVDRIQTGRNCIVRSGFIETTDVNAIDEMVDVLTAQRSFESAEKVASAIDGVRQKSGNDVARVK